jgi:poly(A) polymerase
MERGLPIRIPCEQISADARSIVGRLTENGFTAYVVGGAVRDLVMGIEPKDYDIVTNAGIDQVAGLFERTVPVGARFGISLVVLHGKAYEVARFRTDGAYVDGRRPVSVTPATAEDDVRRRDFTINALLYDCARGEVIDSVGGLGDIRNRIVRTIGDPAVRFAEDRLRMLRAVRFAARLGFDIEPATLAAVRDHAPSVLEVSPERIGQELTAMFSGPNPDRSLDLLDQTGLLAVVLPEIAALKDVAQPPEFHPEGDVFIHTRKMLRLFGGGSVTLAFGILFHDVGKASTQTFEDRIRFSRHDTVGARIACDVLKRLRFSNEIVERVAFLVDRHMDFANVTRMRKSVLCRFISQDGFDELLELHRLDSLSSHGDLGIYDFIRKFKTEEPKAGPELPPPLLNGDDLIALGYTPGPLFKTMLSWVYDEQLEGRVATWEEAVSAVRKEFPPEQSR